MPEWVDPRYVELVAAYRAVEQETDAVAQVRSTVRAFVVPAPECD